MKEFEFEGKWRKSVIEENLKDHVMSLTANAFKIAKEFGVDGDPMHQTCLLYTSPSPRDRQKSRMPSSA